MNNRKVKIKVFVLYIIGFLIILFTGYFASQKSNISAFNDKLKNQKIIGVKKLTTEQEKYYWEKYGLNYVKNPKEWLLKHLQNKENIKEYQSNIDSVWIVWQKNYHNLGKYDNLELKYQNQLKNYFINIFTKGFFDGKFINIQIKS